MTFGVVLSSAVTPPKEAQFELPPAVLADEVLTKRLAYQSRDGHPPLTGQCLEISFNGLIDEKGRSLHMMYSSIHLPQGKVL